MQRMRIHPLILALLSATACLQLAACGASAPPKRASTAPEPRDTGKAYDFRSEGKVPPPGAADLEDEPDVEEIAVPDERLEVSEAEAPPDTTPPPAAPADSLIDGFRIQVFATQDREVAENARQVAAERLGVPAYLDLEGGVYKVRVGDYPGRADADAALATARGHYYPDAWVVPAKVKAPRVSR